ncbi:MAG: hypothetical protein ACFCGT_26810 [Sandaracinaceae bacterium]
MRRTILIALFSFGTVFGFGSALAHGAPWSHHHRERREAFERHVADVCVDAAERRLERERPRRPR